MFFFTRTGQSRVDGIQEQVKRHQENCGRKIVEQDGVLSVFVILILTM
jgi:hypothetical protein